MRSAILKLAAGIVLFSLFPARSADPPAPPLRTAEIVAHLARTIAWHKKVAAVEQASQPSSDILARDKARAAATRALQLAFDFGRAAVPLVAPEPGAAPSSTNMTRASERAIERVAKAEAQIAELDAALAKGGSSRAVLAARRNEVVAELNFARLVRDSLQNIRSLATGGADLLSYVDRLERTVPEALRTASQQPATASAETAAVHSESPGMLALVTEVIAMSRAQGRYGEALTETEIVRKSFDQLNAPLRADLLGAIRRGEEAIADSAFQTAEQIDADRREIERLGARFKQVSAAMAPLREHGVQVALVRVALIEQRDAAESRYKDAGRTLLLRAGGLIVTIAFVLAISVVWRRGAFRYVRDTRRRKQFLLLRRVVVSGVVLVVIAVALVNEMGSLATYAGFLTAGLAVALQNPISAVVAYFFLIGRYGLKVGDRVTIAGVTGDIVEIGLVRLYLMEMTGDSADVHPTGRLVGYSNSVIFQPGALFRQMPGAEYVWHAISLTLAPDADPSDTEALLMTAVNGVYEQYRARVEQQHAAFQRLVDVPLPAPKPVARLRHTAAGLEVVVRYPVEIRQATLTDDQVADALSDAIARAPGLGLAPAGAPKLIAGGVV